MRLLNVSLAPLSYMLVSGTAGGIEENIKLNDVVVAEKAFEAEIQDAFTLLKDTPFENCLKHPINNLHYPPQYSADPDLLKIFDSLVFTELNIYKGTIVSSDAFPAPKELFEKVKYLNPYCIDMETSSIYQIAWLLNIKVLAVRGISNILNAYGCDDNIRKSDVKNSCIAAAKVLLAILNKSIFLKNQENMRPSNKFDGEASQLVKEYDLKPHPEGGYFAAVYKSQDIVKPSDCERYNNENRSAGTSIYYLLNNNDYSAWHTLKSDELWHYYKGSPLNIHVIDINGNISTYLLGDPLKTKIHLFKYALKREIILPRKW